MAANTPQAPREAQLSALCQGCGFCCDGTLFTHVALEEAEAAQLEGSPVQLVRRASGGRSLTQPCGALEGCRCAVYAQRPRGCRGFTCLLGRALLEGELDLAQAQQQVEDTRALRAALAALLPGALPSGAALAQARRQAAAQQLSPAAKEAWQALERHLRFHYHRA